MIRPKLVAVFDNIKDTINIMTAIYPKKEKDPEAAYNEAKLIEYQMQYSSNYKMRHLLKKH